MASKFCRQCGHEVGEGKNFCAACGKPIAALAQPQSATDPAKKYCSKCGRPVVNGRRFCGGCGRPAAPSAAASEPERVPIETALSSGSSSPTVCDASVAPTASATLLESAEPNPIPEEPTLISGCAAHDFPPRPPAPRPGPSTPSPLVISASSEPVAGPDSISTPSANRGFLSNRWVQVAAGVVVVALSTAGVLVYKHHREARGVPPSPQTSPAAANSAPAATPGVAEPESARPAGSLPLRASDTDVHSSGAVPAPHPSIATPAVAVPPKPSPAVTKPVVPQPRTEALVARDEIPVNSGVARASTPALVEPSHPRSGTLHYAGSPVHFGEVVVFQNLPNQRLRFIYNRSGWQAFISRKSDGTQTLTLRSLLHTEQAQCDVQWEMVP